MNQLVTSGLSHSTQSTDTNPWYSKYLGLPYIHLGDNPKTGIDCFNLCRLIYKEQLNIDIPYDTADWCNIVDEDWYSKTHDRPFERGSTAAFGWEKVKTPEKFNVITMSIGVTNVTNHCALYIGNNRMIQTMIDKKSWIAPYGSYYKTYTMGIFKWIGMPN
jgi:cell wall-associated NlpC family hydrolase|tara:strand:- start:53 stop:535 length:483 start_codon:yes stop_codon:yes gene_type:complete